MQYLGHTQHLSKTRAALLYHLNVLFQYSKAEKSEDGSVILEALWQGYTLAFYPCSDDAHSLCIYIFMDNGLVNNTTADVIYSRQDGLSEIEYVLFYFCFNVPWEIWGFELFRYRVEHLQSQQDLFRIILLLQ